MAPESITQTPSLQEFKALSVGIKNITCEC